MPVEEPAVTILLFTPPVIVTVPVQEVNAVELNALEPNSLVPTTLEPFIIKAVASEF